MRFQERWTERDIASLLGGDAAAWDRVSQELRGSIRSRWPKLSPADRDRIRTKVLDRLEARKMSLLRDIRNPGSLSSLLTVLVKRVGSHLAKKPRPLLESEGAGEDGGVLAGVESRPERNPGRRRRAALEWLDQHKDRLSPDQVLVAKLRVRDRLTYTEIGGILKKTPDACKQLFRRALRGIKRIAKAEGSRIGRTPRTH